MNKQKVAGLVRSYLKDCHPYGMTLEVIEPEIRQEQSWWNVPIRLSIDPPKLYKLFEVLTKAEIELKDNENVTVFLSVVFPESDDSAEPQPPPKPRKKRGRATKKKVAAVVREYLKGCHPGGVTIEVVEENIYKSYYEWRVPLRTDFEPPNHSEFTEEIIEVETEILENEGWNVYLTLDEPTSDAQSTSQDAVNG
jgi:hypothetical protein